MRKKKLPGDNSPLLWGHLFPEDEQPEEKAEVAPEPPPQKPSEDNTGERLPAPKTISDTPYREAYKRLTGRFPISIHYISITFYPYSNLQARMWRENGTLHVKMTDVMADMPERFHKALALILVGRHEKKPYPKEEDQVFNKYAAMPEVQQVLRQRAVSRKRKPKTYGVQGEKYNLEEVFNKVNRIYFKAKLKQPVLSWTRDCTRRRMGYVTGNPPRVYISKTLDRKSTPRYAIDFIMYHELLHIVMGSVKKGKRVYHHTREFREAEKKFKKYNKAARWLNYKV
jgi:hypothetical protein